MNTINAVRDLLQRFQAGYRARDLSQLDSFMTLFVNDDSLEVIGTNAVEPGKDEWCLGLDAARELIAGDWEHWGDVVFDVAGARIHAAGDVAWLATTGTVTDTIPQEDLYGGYLEFVTGVVEDQELPPRDKLLEIVRLGNDIVSGLTLPETYVWPFRLTAVAVREANQWRFRQMQFSFATTRAPDVRTL